MKLDTLLRDQIESDFKELGTIEVGTEKYKTGVDGVTRLVDRVIELEKLKQDSIKQEINLEQERELKLIELDIDKKDRALKNILTGLGVIGGFGLTIWGTYKTFEFENTGSITTIMGRSFIGRLMPKK